MTVENSNNRDRLTADGIIVDFDFTTKIFNTTELQVYIIDNNDVAVLQTISTDYSIVIATITEGGTVTFVTAPTDTYEVLMIRNVPYTQSTDIPVNEGFSEVTIENALDRLAIQIQQVNDILSKTIKISDTSTVTGLSFEDPESEKLIRWKSDLTGFENIVLTDISVIEADITIGTGDAKKVVNVNSAETQYELSSVKDLIELITTGGLTINTILKQTKGADVNSASAVTLGDDGNFFDIAGTTNITSITAKSAGTEITLQFDGILTVVDGGNLKIRGDFVTATESTLRLISDGTNWFEISRSIEEADLFKNLMGLPWMGAISAIPSGWVLCDGNNSTPDLTDRSILHADADSSGTNDVGDTGGVSTHALTTAELATHDHQYIAPEGGSATHNGGNSNSDENARTGSAGSGSTHTNRDKFHARAYIMKT